jgi:hypothetical protein
MANLGGQWKAVGRGRSKSLSEAGQQQQAKTKSARKNARRRERKEFEKKWGVSVEEAAAMEASVVAADAEEGGGRMRCQSVIEQVHFSPLPCDDDGALRRALEASLSEAASTGAPNSASNNSDSTDDDVRRKRLRNLKKKISAAEVLGSIPQSDLDAGQRTKLERLSSLMSEAAVIEDELARKQEQQRQIKEERKARELAVHKQRISEWSDLSDGTAVEGFLAGADRDEFACVLCAGPLEAAVACTPCKHLFCRACLEDTLDSAARRTGGDPKSLCCPLCRSLLYDAKSDKMLVEAAMNARKRMRKRKCSCRCGEEVLLSSLRAHLRQCDAAAPELFKGDEKRRFGHSFQRPWLDPDLVAEMAGRKKRPGGSGHIRSTQQAIQRGLVAEDYDEDAALQAALALSALET